MAGNDIGIDLGSSYIRIYVSGSGIVLREPSVVTLDTYNDEVMSVGQQAYEMIGKTSERFSVLYPMKGGVISDYGLTEQMITYFIKKVCGTMVFMPRVVVCIPGEITEVERRAVLDAIRAAGARKVCLIEEPVAAAIGAGMDISSPHGCMVVDIGGGTTDMAVLSLSGISISDSLKVAGKAFDDAIIKYVRRKYSIHIGDRMAEEVKKAIGCLYPFDEPRQYRVKGRNALTGLPQWVDVSSDEMLEAMLEPAKTIVSAVQNMLEETPPELVSDVYTDGIYLTGGSAQIHGFDMLISKKTRLDVHVAENPQDCVVLGCGKALKYIDDVTGTYGITNPLISE